MPGSFLKSLRRLLRRTTWIPTPEEKAAEEKTLPSSPLFREILAFKDQVSRVQDTLRIAEAGVKRPPAPDPAKSRWSAYTISPFLQVNLDWIQEDLGNPADLMVRRLVIGVAVPIQAAVIYLQGMADRAIIQEHIIRPLVDTRRPPGESLPEALADLRLLPNLQQIFSHAHLKTLSTLGEVEDGILEGQTVLILDGLQTALEFATKGFKVRAVEEPVTESVLRGPRDGFNEALRINTSLIRRRIRTPNLRLVEHEIGHISKTKVAVLYIEGIARPEVVAEVNRRLDRIEMDSVLETGYLEEFIEDQPLSPFPQISRTERPDVVVGNLLEGRVAIIVDGTPTVLMVPCLFWQLFQAAEDYYNRSLFSSFVRWIRYISALFLLGLPAFYVAATTFHQEIIPFALLLNLSAARNPVPIPVVMEVILMELTFEALREGGIRLPRTVGSAITIVGALILGDAAVTAGLVSPMVIIVVASTAIASFTIPASELTVAFRLIRFPVIILASVLGFFGFFYALLVVLIHLVSLRSFGVPYLAPLFSTRDQGMRDVLIRAPWWSQTKRPGATSLGGKRVAVGLKPGPPANRDPDAGWVGDLNGKGGGSGA